MTKTTTIDPKLIDQLIEQTAPEDLLGENGLIKQLPKPFSSEPYMPK
jgi:hypothetical protein